jgi:hypothetical protein
MKRESKKERERRRREIEDRVIRILTKKRLSAFKTMIEKDHAIDCILLSLLGKGQWKHAKEFTKRLKLTLPDGTYRARMMEMEMNGLLKHDQIDVKKKRWAPTKLGLRFGELLIEFFSRFDDGGPE